MPALRLAGDRVARRDPDGQRQQERQAQEQRRDDEEQPVAGHPADEPRALAAERGVLREEQHRARAAAARAASPASRTMVAAPAEARGAARCAHAAAARRTRAARRRVAGADGESASDIEALPGQLDEDLLEARSRAPRAPAGRRPACTSAADDLLGRHRARAARDTVTPVGLRRRVEPEPGRAPPRRRRRASARRRARTRARRRCVGERRAVALEQQVAAAHDPDVRAHLLDLGQQVRRDQHGRAVRRRARAPGGGPRGCPAGRGRWSARRARAARAGAAARRPGRAAASCRASTAGTAWRPRRRARRARAPRRRAAGPCAGPRSRRWRRAGRGWPAPVRYGWNAGPSTSAPTRGSTAAPASGIGAAEQARPPAGRPDQAEQHPDRRRLARAVRAEEPVDRAARARAGRCRRRPPARSGTAWSGPRSGWRGRAADATGAARRGRGSGRAVGHWAASACSVSPGTAPTSTRPSSVTSTRQQRRGQQPALGDLGGQLVVQRGRVEVAHRRAGRPRRGTNSSMQVLRRSPSRTSCSTPGTAGERPPGRRRPGPRRRRPDASTTVSQPVPVTVDALGQRLAAGRGPLGRGRVGALGQRHDDLARRSRPAGAENAQHRVGGRRERRRR